MQEFTLLFVTGKVLELTTLILHNITEKEGTTWIRKATDTREWKTLMEDYILQWMDKA